MRRLVSHNRWSVAVEARSLTTNRVPIPLPYRGGVSFGQLAYAPPHRGHGGTGGGPAVPPTAAASANTAEVASATTAAMLPLYTPRTSDPHRGKSHGRRLRWRRQGRTPFSSVMYGSRVRTATAVVPAAAAAGGSGGGSGAAMSLGDLQLDIPEIDGDIRSLQVEMGAIFNDSGLAATFGRKRQALQALETGLVLVDQSHWGRLRVTGEDRTALLHNQSTADFQRLQPGQCADTTFVTSTARCLDLATALVLPSSILLLVDSREGGEALAARLDKVIFRGDNVMVHDISSRTGQIAVLGPEAEVVLRELAPDVLSGVLSGPPGRHVLVGFRGKPVFVAAVSGLGLSVPGYTLVADEAVAGDLYAAFAAKGAIPMGTDDWEAARIVAGRPTRGSELTEAYSPLEAGLYGAVSLNKGCYIGQETLAKLHLRDGVNRQLWGLRLSGPTSPGAEIYSELSKVGVVTSTCQDADGEWVGVGYLRSRLEGTQIELEGVRVAVAGAPATVTAIPFATRKFSAEAESPAVRAAAVVAATGEEDAASIAARLEEAKRKKAEVQVEKQAATEAKLKAMQERVAAWQAALQQQQQGQQQ